jgi:hypothetical protein
LKDSGIKVNSADPGYAATDLNGRRGHQTIPGDQRQPSVWRFCRTMVPREASSTREHADS